MTLFPPPKYQTKRKPSAVRDIPDDAALATVTIRLPPPVPASHVRKGKHGTWFTAEPYKSWRDAAELAVRRAWPHVAMLGPVALDVVAVSLRPEKKPAWCPSAVWKQGARIYRPVRPDLENFGEGVADALQVPKHLRTLLGVTGYPMHDDGQVVRMVMVDVLAAVGEEPHTMAMVTALEWFP